MLGLARLGIQARARRFDDFAGGPSQRFEIPASRLAERHGRDEYAGLVAMRHERYAERTIHLFDGQVVEESVEPA